MNPMRPWYRGFKGKIEKLTDTCYLTRGKYHIEGDNKAVITELPVNLGQISTRSSWRVC